jgi:hypothetical protein
VSSEPGAGQIAYFGWYEIKEGANSALWKGLAQVPTCGLSLVGIFLMFALADEVLAKPRAGKVNVATADQLKSMAISLLMLCMILSVTFTFMFLLSTDLNQPDAITNALVEVATAASITIYVLGWLVSARYRAALDREKRP